ncbi:MAG: hemerythrin domain-containing protein [Acidithiobacillus ferrivorans]|jgi:hemerythrin-like domain-containing protein
MRLLGNAAPSFDDPVGLLRACHERILGHCETLERLAEHLARVGADSEARLAATRIRRYFHVAGPAHHADEEKQLFPWLLAQPDFPPMLRAAVRNLTAQHRELEAAWRVLDADLAAVESEEQPEALHLEPFISMNRAHVVLENGEIFPVAEKLLEEGEARRLGAAMAKRRVEED